MSDIHLNSSASGYISDSFEGISREFTDVEVILTSEVNVVSKGKRYGRWWLLKALRSEISAHTAYQHQLRKEFEILMQMQHPGVVATIGLEPVDGMGQCIVMEFVDGKSLNEWLADSPNLKRREKVANDLMQALEYIHSKNIVHRDLKPENILIARNGDTVKLIDFGLADTDSHAVLKQPAGTLGYMSPEQLQFAVADVRNDIYSLGKILEKMQVGPAKIIKKCLQPIDCRYQNVAELRHEIQKHNRRAAHLATITILAAIAILAGGLIWQTIRIERFENQAIEDNQKHMQLQQNVAMLTDSLLNIKNGYEKLQGDQEKQQAQRLKIEKAIAEGNDIADKALAKTHLLNIIDTLRYKDYGFEAVGNGGLNVNNAVNEYLTEQRSQFSETEIAEITNAVYTHTTNIMKPIVDKLNSLP